jgi:hypothetical protein
MYKHTPAPSPIYTSYKEPQLFSRADARPPGVIFKTGFQTRSRMLDHLIKLYVLGLSYTLIQQGSERYEVQIQKQVPSSAAWTRAYDEIKKLSNDDKIESRLTVARSTFSHLGQSKPCYALQFKGQTEILQVVIVDNLNPEGIKADLLDEFERYIVNRHCFKEVAFHKDLTGFAPSSGICMSQDVNLTAHFPLLKNSPEYVGNAYIYFVEANSVCDLYKIRGGRRCLGDDIHEFAVEYISPQKIIAAAQCFRHEMETFAEGGQMIEFTLSPAIYWNSQYRGRILPSAVSSTLAPFMGKLNKSSYLTTTKMGPVGSTHLKRGQFDSFSMPVKTTSHEAPF